MTDAKEHTVLELPKVYLVRMTVFMLVVTILAVVLFPHMQRAFMANPGLNGVIIGALLLGVGYSFRIVLRLWPEINWVNGFKISDPAHETTHTPRLLGPMATLFRDRPNRTVLSPLSMRSLLDSIASRLDEARDISRYMVGLLIFLGLLGTFWGLLETVTSVGDAIRALDVSSAQSATVFEELKTGLEAPLSGMGLAFSSSLFGLAGSLILGFLELQASQAQNRFYNDLEDWLSTITDIQAGESGTLTVPHYLRLDMAGLQKGIERINQTLDEALAAEPVSSAPAAVSPASSFSAPGLPTLSPQDGESMEKLADAVASLVQQMREEQKIVRQWAQAQQVQQNEMQKLILRTAKQPPQGPVSRFGTAAAVEDE
ncbi:flagellar motor protein MotA [Nordella sp. HKS 07]|uniref:flagellar motor protein MotA n=1 Tax=Nordella sp. HKS 07 TaxID=2712222 RepID=UPI0013E18D8E|nr:flagellar motor protein MotA [Nordella sp. HKS 07]QIG46913.1 flagellar motor protein MotA [Nordella sp. HKS 07]